MANNMNCKYYFLVFECQFTFHSQGNSNLITSALLSSAQIAVIVFAKESKKKIRKKVKSVSSYYT